MRARSCGYIRCHHVSRHVPSCTDEALDTETCMSADCTIQ